jgi:1-acyl-sn-glycerol-3-phosphate acyltransferase
MLKIIRIIFVLGYFFAIAFIGSLISLLRPFNPDNTRICGRLFSWGSLKILGIKLKIENIELLDHLTPCVVIANHQDNLDLFVHGGVIPKRTVSIGKKSLMYLPLFGQVYWLAGNIMIDRKKSKESINAMSETSNALKNKNTSIWVFAEGTRNKGNNLLPFKKGAFHIAQQASVPILPICASSYPKHINLNKLDAGTVILRVLPPVETKLIKAGHLDDLRTQLHAQMQATIDELDDRIQTRA